MRILVASVLLLSGLASGTQAQTALTYQKAPAAIEALLDAPLTPVVKASPDHSKLLVQQLQSFPTIAEVAQPRYRLAGIRFNPATNGPSREVSIVKLSLQPLAGGAPQPIAGLPTALKASHLAWSPDSKHVAFVQRETNALQLWVVDAAKASARRVGTFKLNAVLGAPCDWIENSAALLCKIVPMARGAAPVSSEIPAGPNVEENLGKVTPARTYEDLLRTPTDEAIFAFYATSDLAVVSLDGTSRTLPVKGLIADAVPSPDGRFAFVETLHRPFSYALPVENFPAKVSVVNLNTGAVKDLSDHALLDSIPIAFDAVQVGARDYAWRSDAPATLVWIEAQDGGNPKVTSAVRDRLMQLSAPFDGQNEVVLDSPMRLRGVEWGNDHLALATEWRWSDRKIAFVAFDPSSRAGTGTTLYEGSSQDRYHSPGRAVTQINAHGKPALQLTRDGKGIYFFSAGATPEGDLPFVGVMPLGGGTEQIQWRSAKEMYEEPISLLADGQVLVRQESQSISPNYFVAILPQQSGAPELMKQVTNFPPPTPVSRCRPSNCSSTNGRTVWN